MSGDFHDTTVDAQRRTVVDCRTITAALDLVVTPMVAPVADARGSRPRAPGSARPPQAKRVRPNDANRAHAREQRRRTPNEPAVTLTYVYCLVRSAAAPGAARRAGRRPRRRRRRGCSMPARVCGPSSSACRQATTTRRRWPAACRTSTGSDSGRWHTRRWSSTSSASPAVLPMQLFTLFTSDERALAARRPRPSSARPDPAQHRAAARMGPASELRRTGRPSTGRRRAPTSPARRTWRASAICATCRQEWPHGRDARRRTALHGPRAEATAARRRTDAQHIAPGSRAAGRRGVSGAGAARRRFPCRAAPSRQLLGTSGVVVSLTGPWPPYNFITPLPRASTRTRASGARASTAPARATAAARRKRAAR